MTTPKKVESNEGLTEAPLPNGAAPMSVGPEPGSDQFRPTEQLPGVGMPAQNQIELKEALMVRPGNLENAHMIFDTPGNQNKGCPKPGPQYPTVEAVLAKASKKAPPIVFQKGPDFDRALEMMAALSVEERNYKSLVADLLVEAGLARPAAAIKAMAKDEYADFVSHNVDDE